MKNLFYTLTATFLFMVSINIYSMEHYPYGYGLNDYYVIYIPKPKTYKYDDLVQDKLGRWRRVRHQNNANNFQFFNSNKSYALAAVATVIYFGSLAYIKYKDNRNEL